LRTAHANANGSEMKIEVDPVIPGGNPIMADGKIKPD
jgi:hypothetical protein